MFTCASSFYASSTGCGFRCGERVEALLEGVQSRALEAHLIAADRRDDSWSGHQVISRVRRSQSRVRPRVTLGEEGPVAGAHRRHVSGQATQRPLWPLRRPGPARVP